MSGLQANAKKPEGRGFKSRPVHHNNTLKNGYKIYIGYLLILTIDRFCQQEENGVVDQLLMVSLLQFYVRLWIVL